MALTIRLATKADYAALVELNGEVQQIHAEAHPDIFKWPTDPKRITTYFKKAICDDPCQRVFVAVLDGSIVGYVQCKLVERKEDALCHAQWFAYVIQIAVRSTNRRQGIGQALIETVFDFARKHLCTQVSLQQWSFNQAAEEFFSKLGFSSPSRSFNIKL